MCLRYVFALRERILSVSSARQEMLNIKGFFGLISFLCFQNLLNVDGIPVRSNGRQIVFKQDVDTQQRLIEFESGSRQWMNFHEIMELIAENKHFIDMTDHQYLESKMWDLPRKQSPDSPRYQTTVNSINSRRSNESKTSRGA